MLLSQISSGSRNQTHMKCATAEKRLIRKLLTHLFLYDAARQKSDCIITRCLCNWLCCNVCKSSLQHLSLQNSLSWETVLIQQQGRLQKGLNAVELITQLMQNRLVRESASQLINSIKAVEGDCKFSWKLFHTLLTWSSQLWRDWSRKPDESEWI